MARISLTVGTRYVSNAQVYCIRQHLVDSRFLVENQSFGGQCILTLTELVDAWGRGEIQFEVRGRHVQPPIDGTIATSYTIADFQQLPAHLREEAWRRYNLLLPLLHRPTKERTRRHIIAYAKTLCADDTLNDDMTFALTNTPQRAKRSKIGEAKSWASLERWLTGFITSGYDLRSLVPEVERSARKGEARLDEAAEAIVQAVIAECAAKPQYRTAKDVYFDVVNRIAAENRTRPSGYSLSIPGPATIYRRIKRAGVEQILRRQRSRVESQVDAPVHAGPSVSCVLQRVEMDHTLLDLFIVDEEDRLPIGRPTLTYALDVYSGFPLGFYVSFTPASYLSVARCLLHGILPKPNTATLYETVNPWLAYGLPDLLIVDNAKEMIGSDLLAACGQLGITLECMPVRTPWFKGHIERFFRTNNTGLIHTLPGTTFSNILDRGDYDVFQHACISLKAFIKLLHIFLLDVYAQSMHEGLGAIPAHRWQESIAQGFMPMLHTSAQETKIFLMHSDTRTVQRSGIEFEGLFYRSPDLARLRTLLPSQDRTVRIKFDPEDISTLYVSDPVDHRWIAVQAAGQAYAQGLSLWKHQIIRRYARHHNPQVDIEGLAAAKAYIQRIAVEEFVLTQQGRGRKEAARFLGVGIHDPVSVDLAVVSQTPSNELTSQPSLSSDRTAPSKPRKSSQKKSSQLAAEEVTAVQTSSTPASTDNDIDLAGWGGDYHLPLV